MFNKKKKKPQISLPSNFEHRVHTGFDKREGRYVGLPLQWASIVGNNQILKSTNRPLPLVDPSEITHTEILDLKTIVRPHFNNNKIPSDDSSRSTNNTIAGQGVPPNGLALPKTSHVARSNSLRSSSPPRVRRDLRGNANVPPSVPEEVLSPIIGPLQSSNDSTGAEISQGQSVLGGKHHQQLLSIRRDPTSAAIPTPTKPVQISQPNLIDWNRQIYSLGDHKGQNGNSLTVASSGSSVTNTTETPGPYFRLE